MRARSEVEISVRRRCRHNEVHPHSVTVEPGPGSRWCTDGDFQLPTDEELVRLFFDTLTGTDPRVETERAMVQAPRLLEALKGLVR
jgi:hypothetical protein